MAAAEDDEAVEVGTEVVEAGVPDDDMVVGTDDGVALVTGGGGGVEVVER